MIKYYCSICDVEIGKEELLEGCCPYCETDKPGGTTREILKLFPEYEPVELEALGDEEIVVAVCGDCPFESKFSNEECHACRRQLAGASQATIQHNQAKGQLYRIRSEKE